MILQEIVLSALKDLSARMRRKIGPTVEMVAEFRQLAETAQKLGDMQKVAALEARLLDLENRFNLSRVPQSPGAEQQKRKTPRLM